MRARRIWISSTFGLALAAAGVVAACAADGTEPSPAAQDADSAAPATPIPTSERDGEGGPSDGGPDAGALEPLPCSDAGWCATRTPERDTRFFALTSFEKTAFALAWIKGRTTPLHFDGDQWNVLAADPWTLVRQGTQKLYALASTNEHELWVGGEGGLLAHGVETSGTWAWTVEALGTNETVRAIFAPSSAEVLVAAGTRLYRHASSGAPQGDAAPGAGAGWTIAYENPGHVVGDEENLSPVPATFTSIVGDGEDDVWLVGSRAGVVAHVVHRKGGQWRLVADADCMSDDSELVQCWDIEGMLRYNATLANPIALGNRQIIGMGPWSSIARFGEADDGTYRLNDVSGNYNARALWQPHGGGRTYVAGFGLVMTNDDVWGGSREWKYSTISLYGSATMATFDTFAGTTESNMWVAGEFYALHRVVP